MVDCGESEFEHDGSVQDRWEDGEVESGGGDDFAGGSGVREVSTVT